MTKIDVHNIKPPETLNKISRADTTKKVAGDLTETTLPSTEVDVPGADADLQQAASTIQTIELILSGAKGGSPVTPDISTPSLTTDASPLEGMFQKPIALEEASEQIRKIAMKHGGFFRKFEEATKSANPIQALKQLEEVTGANLTIQQRNALFNAYRSLSMNQVKRFFEKLQILGIEVSDSMRADYVLALNRLGYPNEAILESFRYFERNILLLSSRDKSIFNPKLEIAAEFMIGLGTAYKNMFMVSKALEIELGKTPEKRDSEKIQYLSKMYKNYFNPTGDELLKMKSVEWHSDYALDLSRRFYNAAFEITKSYYPGINVVRNLLYSNKTEEAKQLARLVRYSALQADTQNSFWPRVALLETALVTEDENERNRVLPEVVNLFARQESSDIGSLLEHLYLWRTIKVERNEIEGVRILDDTISKLENALKTETQPSPPKNLTGKSKYASPEEAFSATTFKIGKTRRGNSFPNNARWGGIVVDTTTTLEDKSLMHQVINHQGPFPFSCDGKSLASITDIEEAVNWVNEYIIFAYRLKNSEGVRDLESMDNPRHIELEAFWRGFLDFVCIKDSKMAATSVMSKDGIGMGDCRHTNYDGEYFLSSWQENLQQFHITRALNALRQKDYRVFEEAIGSLDNLTKTDFVLMTVQVHANVQSDGPYQIRRDKNGNALLSDKLEHIDNHTLTFRIDYTDGNKVKIQKVGTKDFWYNRKQDDKENKNLFILGDNVITEKSLQDFAEKGYLIIENGAEVLDPAIGKMIKIPLKFIPRFSGPNQSKSRRYDPLDLICGSQKVDSPSVNFFFDPKQREEFYKNFIVPIMIRGLEIMSEEDGPDKERAQNYLCKLLGNKDKSD